MLRPARLCLAVLSWSSLAHGSTGGATLARDLLPLLREADICAHGRCAPAGRAEPTDSAEGPVTLRADAGRDLYLRLGDRPEVELEVEAVRATLHVEIEADGSGEQQRVYDALVAGHRTIRIALDALAGHIARLALRVATPEAGAQIVLSGAVLRDALPADPPLLARFAGADGRPPNVVVYVIDTLRADHVGCYGYRRPTTPRIDEFARSAVRFGRAVAQSSWTLPAVASILTGLYPLHHGAIDPDHAIRPDVATLAGVLAARGWTTAGFVTNYLGSDVYGLGRGFQTYRFYREQGARRRAVYLRSDAVLRRVEHWLERGPRNPFLLYVHVTDPHFPYVPPPRSVRPFWTGPPSPAEIDTLTDRVRMLHNGQADWGTRPAPVSPHDIALLGDLYDGEIRFADEYFGRLLDALQKRGLLDTTVVVLTSDHGEEFLEHGGVGHGQTLHAEVVNVPMIIRLAGAVGGGTQVDRTVQQIDVLPTILDASGVPVPPDLDGLSWLAPQGPVTSTEAFATVRLGPFDQQAVVADSWKAIRDFDAPPGSRVRLFDTRTDPGELHDAGATAPLLLGYARARLREVAGPLRPGPVVPDNDRLDRLRALGYVAE